MAGRLQERGRKVAGKRQEGGMKEAEMCQERGKKRARKGQEDCRKEAEMCQEKVREVAE